MALTPDEVTNLYESILFRAPNAHELNVGQSNTEEGLTDSLIATSVVEVLPFILIYQAAFNRTPDAVGLDEGLGYWVNAYRDGNLNIWDYTAQIVATPEFHDVFDALPTPNAVNQIYLYALGRNAEQDGLNFWVNLINSGQKSLTDVLFDISQSPESLARNGDSAENLQRAVAAGETEFDGEGSLTDWAPEPAPVDPVDQFLTTSPTDRVVLAAGDSVSGDASGNQFTDTYNGTDQITGVAGSGNEFFLGVNNSATTSASVTNVDTVSVQHSGGAETEVVVKNWKGVKDLNLTKIQNNFRVTDIQDGATRVNLTDVVWRQDGTDVTLDYDTNETTNEANISVNEVRGNVYVVKGDQQAGVVETINLEILDRDEDNSESILGDLLGVGTKTLTISGGNVGRKFVIENPLNATLTLLDATDAVANLSLNISDSARVAINAQLGSGNDTLKTGDTLKSADVLDGGDGRDTLTAVFTSGGTRSPTVTNFEVFDLTFNANTVLNFENVDDVDTINIRQSSNPFRLHELDSTVATLNVSGRQANSTHHIYFADDARDSNLQVNWKNASGSNDGNWQSDGYLGHWYLPSGDGGAGTLDVVNAGEFHFTHSGEFSTFFTARSSDSTDDAWQFDVYLTDAVTRVLTVENTGQGDLVLVSENQYSIPTLIEFPSCGCECGYSFQNLADIGGTNKVTELSFKTTDTGNIELRDVRNVAALRNFTVDANNAGDIFINSIGWSGIYYSGQDNPSPFNAALRLETIDIHAAQKSIANVNFVNGLYNTSSQTVSNGATLSSINITAENSSEANLWGIAVGDVEDVQINIANGGSVGVCKWELANDEDVGNSLGTLVVKGAGTLNEDGQYGYWEFTNQAIASQDFSGLTKDTVWVSFLHDNDGVTLVGTNNNTSSYWVGNVDGVGSSYANGNGPAFYNISVRGDAILGGNGDDNISAGGGDDFVYTGGGSNIVDLGAGNDHIVIAKGASAEITTGAGSDSIYVNSVGAGNITDFNLNADKIYLDIGNINQSIDFTLGNGISNVDYTLVNGAGVAIDGVAYPAPQFKTVNGNTLLDSATTVVNLAGQWDSLNEVQTVIQIGGSHQIRTANELDNPWDGGAAQPDNDGAALLLSWVDTSGDQHLAVARVVDSQQLGNGTWAYNYDIVDLIGLDATYSHLNQINLGFLG